MAWGWFGMMSSTACPQLGNRAAVEGGAVQGQVGVGRLVGLGRPPAGRQGSGGPFVTGGALPRYRQPKSTAQGDLSRNRRRGRQTESTTQCDFIRNWKAEPAAQADAAAVLGRGIHGRLQSQQS